MRLTDKQKSIIVDNFLSVFNNINAELRLFGSRVDDKKLGGDIDLLITCYVKGYQELSELKEKYEFLLQKKMGNRKIDIVLEFNENCKKLPVVINARVHGVLLAITSFNMGTTMLDEKNILYQRLRSYIDVINFNLETEEKVEKLIKDLKLYPMTENVLIALSTEQRAFIDSLIYRFLIIQDYASAKLFPLIAQIITSQPQQPSWFDILALMEKHQVISSEEQWDKLRKLRNLLSHEYENIPNLRAIDINRLVESLPSFYSQLQLMNNYAKKLESSKTA